MVLLLCRCSEKQACLSKFVHTQMHSFVSSGMYTLGGNPDVIYGFLYMMWFWFSLRSDMQIPCRVGLIEQGAAEFGVCKGVEFGRSRNGKEIIRCVQFNFEIEGR